MKKLLLCLIAACSCLPFHSTAQTILSEDFSSVTPPALPPGWSNTFTAAPGTTPHGWETITAAADYFFSYSTPPRSQYAECTEYYYTGNDPANLTSPVFSLAGTTSPRLNFDFLFNGSHYYDSGVGYFEEAYIQISIDSGATWINMDTLPVGGYWDTRSIDLTPYVGYPHCMLNFRYTDSGGTLFGFLLTNVNVYDPLLFDLGVVSVSPLPSSPNYASMATGISFGGIVTNFGADTITYFDATYQVGTGTPVSCTIFGVSIAPAASYSFTCTTPFTPTVLDSVPVTIWISQPGDTSHLNDTMRTHITGVTHFPVKKPVAEEATATWCDTCPDGIIAMDDEEAAVHDAMSFIAGHCDISTTDPMTEGDYGYWILGQVPSTPYLLFDRKYKQDVSALPGLYDDHHNDFAFADIYMGTPVVGTSVTIPVSVTAATNMQGVYRLVLALTEDRVHSTSTPSNWDQTNIFSGGTPGTVADAEYDFDTLPNPVPATTMYYDHVARSMTPNLYGGDYLPTTLPGGTTYWHNFTVPLNPGWVTANMHAIAMLIDSATGYILNSENIWLTPHSPLGVTTISGITQIDIFPNPAATSLTISASKPITAIAITDLLGQLVYDTHLNGGNTQELVDVSSLPAGIYLVKVNNQATRKFVKE